MNKQRWFVIIWAIVSLLLIGYTIMVEETNRRVIGITEVEETTVSFPFPVEVTNVTVVPNQKIQKGDLLLELNSEELTRQIRKLQLDVSDDGNVLSAMHDLYKSEKDKIEREKNLETQKIESEIENLKVSLANDAAISKSLNIQIKDSILNPKELKLQNLAKEIQLTQNYYRQLQSVAQLKFQADQAKLNRELEDLKQRLEYSLQKQKELRVLALYDGYIKKVRVEKETLMEAFTPLVTYSKRTPVFVRAYTDEDTRLEVAPGATVTVSSASRKWISSEGVIIAESKRITELPERLKIQPLAQEWGQEFLVKLPAENEFLIGEKVLIK